MNRFQSHSSSREFRGALLSVAAFLCIMILFLGILGQTSDAAAAEQKTSLERALRNGCLHCYASEGFYPESLSYLIDHYGITYDEDRFIIHYEPIGSNLPPTIMVIERKGGILP